MYESSGWHKMDNHYYMKRAEIIKIKRPGKRADIKLYYKDKVIGRYNSLRDAQREGERLIAEDQKVQGIEQFV